MIKNSIIFIFLFINYPLIFYIYIKINYLDKQTYVKSYLIKGPDRFCFGTLAHCDMRSGDDGIDDGVMTKLYI